MALSQPRNGTTREEKYLAASCDETNRTREEDHSQIAGACTISRAECREKNLSAPSRGGDISLDIPLYRTPEEDHSQIAGACTISRAECREKNLSAPSRGGDISRDIPLYRSASG